MKSAPRPHLKTYLLLLVIVIFAPLGSVLLGKGMKGVGSAATWSVQGIQPVLSADPFERLHLARNRVVY